jgi:hypothetical protein
MPELPEVQTYRRFLEETALFQTITHFYVEDRKLLTTDYDTLSRALVGNQFTGTHRVGKNLFVRTRTDAVLTLHFGMTGSLTYFRDAEDTPRFARVIFSFSNGFKLGFLCPRKFERVGLTEDVPAYLHAKKLGKDALETDAADLARAFRDQKGARQARAARPVTLAGLGNWIVDDVLFPGGHSPRTDRLVAHGGRNRAHPRGHPGSVAHGHRQRSRVQPVPGALSHPRPVLGHLAPRRPGEAPALPPLRGPGWRRTTWAAGLPTSAGRASRRSRNGCTGRVALREAFRAKAQRRSAKGAKKYAYTPHLRLHPANPSIP